MHPNLPFPTEGTQEYFLHRWMNWATWFFFAATMYLILTEALWTWVNLPGLGNVGFTLVFVLFALLHCTAMEGVRRTSQFFVVAALVSYVMEETGVRTGLIYGPYHYSDMLGAKLGHVPVIIPLAWFMMIYPSWRVAQALVRGVSASSIGGITVQAAIAALVMTGWDMVMDPSMARVGIWVWERGGPYFGVPLRNYLGWLATTFLIYWVVGWLWRRAEPKIPACGVFAALPVIGYAFFAVRYMTPNYIPALQVVAVFSMGMAGFLALARVLMTES